MEDGFDHVIKKRTKHLEGMFLEKKFVSDDLHRIYLRIPSLQERVWCFRQSILSQKRDITNEELLMIIKYMELSKQLLF